ncbi:MAG: hypothetical protein ACTJGP_11380 [Proteus vulgaris]
MGISASMNEPYDNTIIGDAPSSYHTKKVSVHQAPIDRKSVTLST